MSDWQFLLVNNSTRLPTHSKWTLAIIRETQLRSLNFDMKKYWLPAHSLEMTQNTRQLDTVRKLIKSDNFRVLRWGVKIILIGHWSLSSRLFFLISSSFLILSSVVQGDRASSMSPSFLVVEHSRDIRQREKPREKIEENVIKIVKSWENHFCTLLNTCRERWTRYFRCENKKMGNSSL